MDGRNNDARRLARKKKKKSRLLPRTLVLLLSCAIIFGAGKVTGTIVQAVARMLVVSDAPQDEFENKIVIQDKSQANRKTDFSADNNWKLLLVNPWNKIPDNYSVERTTLKNGHSLDKRAYPDLQNMMDDARAEGLSPIICSSFRTMEQQETLFSAQVDKIISRGKSTEEAKSEAAKWVAVPGTSEHQSGLALDMVSLDYQNLDEKQEKTPEQQWLMKNAHKYGFILRYPSNKSDITGIEFEPWHYRYVGKEVAKEIYEKNICLEEYLDSKKS